MRCYCSDQLHVYQRMHRIHALCVFFRQTSQVSLLKNGYQSLWKKMVERHSKEVNYITGAQVTGVKRTPTVEVKYMHAGSAPLAESCLGHMRRYHDKRRGLYYIIFVKAL